MTQAVEVLCDLQIRPSLAVTRPLSHPWIDEAGSLTFPSLLYWSAGQSTLVAVVVEAVAELQSWTPSPQPDQSTGLCYPTRTTSFAAAAP